MNFSFAILMRTTSVILLSFMRFLVYFASKNVNSYEISLWRSLFSLIPIIIYGFATRQIKAIHRESILPLFVMGTIGFSTMILSFTAISNLSNSGATALSYLSPIFSYLAATIYLHEKRSNTAFIATGVGFVGVILFLSDDFSNPHEQGNIWVGTLCGIGLSLVTAIIRTKSKQLASSVYPAAVPIAFSIVGVLLSLPSLQFSEESLSTQGLWLMVGIGVVGGLSQIASIEAINRAPISILSPFEYIGLPSALILELVYLNKTITIENVTGSIFIIITAAFAAKALRTHN